MHTDHTPDEWAALAAYAADAMTDAERVRFEEALAASPPLAATAAHLARLIRTMDDGRPASDAARTAARHQLLARLGIEEIAEASQPAANPPTTTWPDRWPRARVRSRWTWLLGASVMAGLVGVVMWTLWNPAATTPSLTPFQTYATAAGQWATLKLSDGSRVTLAPRTTLGVPHDFGNGDRAVVLDGEAYFEVIHSPSAPFHVTTGSITTRVLGTAFTVRHYVDDRNVQVAVSQGKVAVGGTAPGAPSVTVTAGAIATVSDSTANTAIVGDVSNYTRWARGTLAFTRMPAREVLNTIGHWYGYEFKLQDSALASHLLTVRFDGESEAAVLRSLGVILDVTMTFDGRVVTLTPRRAEKAPTQTRREWYERRLQQPTTEVGR